MTQTHRNNVASKDVILFLVNCGNPGTPRHGKTTATSGYTSGMKVQFSCGDRYTLIGSDSSTCKENGKWSHGVPECVGKYG